MTKGVASPGLPIGNCWAVGKPSPGRRRYGQTLFWGSGVSLHPWPVLKHTLAFPDCSICGGIVSAWLYIAEEGRLFIIRGVGN